MAAFCQDHGTGLALLSPRAPDKGMSLVPAANILKGLYGSYLANAPRIYYGLDCPEKRGVAKDMADNYLALISAGSFLDRLKLLQPWRYGLLQKNVIALLKGHKGMRDMLAILGADNGCIGKTRL